MIIKNELLHPRYDYGGSSWSNSGGARWAFFAIFIVLIVIVILGTLRVNRKRTRQGIQPIYGTRWMTPPSYIQSQTQYNQPSTRDPNMPSNYVPEYSATTNEFDMGFYDNNGNFHPNPNAKTFVPSENNPSIPEEVHHRQGSTGTDGVAINRHVPDSANGDQDHDSDLGDLYRPPPGPPPGPPSRQPPAGGNVANASHDDNGNSGAA